MNAQRLSGWIAAASGVAILVLALAGSVAGAFGQGWTSGTGTTTVPTMMGGGFGPGMMGGAGMMGGGGMMGSGHMGYGGTSSGTTSAIPGAPTVTVTSTEFAFSPAEITLASREANLSLVNKGVVPHDVTVPALGIRVVAAAGQTTTVGLRNLPAGKYAGYCSVPGHADAGMRISVIVQ